MTLTEITAAKNLATGNTFGTDFAGHYDITISEAERIATRAASLDEFEAIWSGEDWWRDAAQ